MKNDIFVDIFVQFSMVFGSCFLKSQSTSWFLRAIFVRPSVRAPPFLRNPAEQNQKSAKTARNPLTNQKPIESQQKRRIQSNRRLINKIADKLIKSPINPPTNHFFQNRYRDFEKMSYRSSEILVTCHFPMFC